MPPALAKTFLRWLLREELVEEVTGDLDEKFYTIKNQSSFRAKLNYWYQALNYLRPFAIKKSNPLSLNPFFMVRHNLLVSLRNFTRYKTTFVINLIGLSTSLACAMLIYLWASNELSIDSFHEKDSRLYQVMELRQNPDNITTQKSTPWLLAEALEEEMPEVEYAAVATPPDWYDPFTLTVGDKNINGTGTYVGKNYFNIFSYPLVEGNNDKLLTDKNSIVISEELAKRLFNTSNVLGKEIEFQHESTYLISGVFANIPSNSSAQFDFALSIEVLKDKIPQAFDWKNSGPNTYLTLINGTKSGEFENKIKDYIKTKTDQTHRSLFLATYSKNYLYGRYENGVQAGGRIEYVQLFTLIAIFILAIACINFMNLATARASRRTKEIGVKKTLGANRLSLVFQYLFESVAISLIALVVALFITYFFLPQFNVITQKHLTLQLNWQLLLPFVGITLLTGLLAGSYPALYLSGFKPAAVLKGKLHTSFSELWIRKGLVVFQFSMSIIFIVSVWVTYKQIEFVQSKNIGYDKENVIYFQIEGETRKSLATFVDELKRIPGIVDVSSLGQSMVGGGNTANISWEGKDPDMVSNFAYRPVNYGAIEMLDLKLKEGRTFSREHNDSLKVIFNEAGIANMGLDNPIGKVIKFGPFDCEIIGIVNDFNFESLHTAIAPLFFILVPPITEKVIVKLETGKEKQTLAALQTFYQEYNPGFTFDFTFLDQDYQAQYESEQRIGSLSKYFAGLAVLISCLGLFGLAAFTAERRQKEIGIRKVMGSSELSIIYLLSTDFTKIVLIAIFIALPVSYYLVTNWLNAFEFRIPLQVWLFIGSGLLALAIAWLTVGLHAFRAARISPSKCLKEE
ncbi:MAG: ABC transporter permease [Cyclobacteriaceae bacterium]